MALLTNLTELSTGSCEQAAATVLPAQLQRLHFHSGVDAPQYYPCGRAHTMAPLTRLELKQLQHLSLRVGFQQPQLLLRIAQLPALTHLALQYDERCGEHLAAATASAWPLLTQLRELEIAHGIPPTQPQWEAILAGAAAAEGLTKLTLDPRMMSDEDWLALELQQENLESDNASNVRWASEVAACASLTKLTCLQDLSVIAGYADKETYINMNLLRGDALALTALTGLTRLVLARAEHGVGTAVATALARSLQQLQSLDLTYCCLQLGSAEGLDCLEAIGRLTQLTELRLYGNKGLTQHGLMQLTGLSRLEQAACPYMCYDTEVTTEALADFWAAVRAQRLLA
jgi:hypothetical protein